MHIHSISMNLDSINPYSAAEKAAAAERARDVRKKLASAGNTDMDGIPGADQASMVSRWTASQQSPPRDEVEYHTASAGKDSDFG